MESDIWDILKLFSVFIFCANYQEVTTTTVFWEESLYLELVEPEEVAYVYKIRPARDFGVRLNFTQTDIELVPSFPSDACTSISNSLQIYGNIAFVERGGCSFLSKAIMAEEAGARAVLIMDNDVDNNDKLIEMVTDGTHRTTSISAFFLLGRDGFMIRQCLNRLQLQYAVVNIPINATLVPMLPRPQPPWSIWS